MNIDNLQLIIEGCIYKACRNEDSNLLYSFDHQVCIFDRGQHMTDMICAYSIYVDK